MSNRNEILREILSDSDLMEKYKLSKADIAKIKCSPPHSKKIIEVMAKIINEYDNKRTARQIYSTIKNLHKI